MYPIFPAQLADTINLGSEFSVTHDGTDKSANVLAAFAKYGSYPRKYRLPRIGSASAMCVLASVIAIPNGSILELDDDVVLNCLRFDVLGSVGPEIPFSFAGATGDQAVTLSALTDGVNTIVQNTVLLLQGCVNLYSTDAGADQLTYDTRITGVYSGEFKRVYQTNGNVVSVFGALDFPYSLTPGPNTPIRITATARIVSPGRATIRRGTIVPIVGVANEVIRGVFATDVIVEEVRFDHTGVVSYPGEQINSITFYNCWDCSVENNIFLRQPVVEYPSTGSASLKSSIIVNGSSQISVSGNEFEGGSTSADFTYTSWIGTTYTAGGIPTVGCRFSNNTVRNAYQGATAHGGGLGHVFEGNSIEGCQFGLSIRSRNCTASNNTIFGTGVITGVGIAFQDGFAGGGIASGNELYDCAMAYQVQWNNIYGTPVPAQRISINGGFVDKAGCAVRVTTSGTQPVQQDALERAVSIKNVTFSRTVNNVAVVDSYANGFEVDGCTLLGGISTPYNLAALIIRGNVANVRIGKNRWDGLGNSLYMLNMTDSAVISDSVVWPELNAAADWNIDEQEFTGTYAGLALGLPADLGILGKRYAMASRALSGRLEISNGVAGSNPFAVTNNGVEVFSVDVNGKFSGVFVESLKNAFSLGAWNDAAQTAINAGLSLPALISSALNNLYGINALTGPAFRSQGYVAVTSLASLAGFSVSRPATTSGVTARAYDSNGKEYAFASNTARLVPGRGIGIFEAATNNMVNGDGAGAILNQSNSGAPTNWTVSPAPGINWTIADSSVDPVSSRRRTVITFSGSTASSQQTTIAFSHTPQLAAAQGQTRTFTFGALLSAGTLTNVSSIVPRITERDTNANSLATESGAAITLTSSLQDVVFTTTLTNAATAYISPNISIITNGAVSFSICLEEMMERQASLVVPYAPTNGTLPTTVDTDYETMACTLGASFIVFSDAEMNALYPSQQILAQWDDGTDLNVIRLSRSAVGAAVFEIIVGGTTVFSRTVAGKTGARILLMAMSFDGTNIWTSCDQEAPVNASPSGSFPAPTIARDGNNVAGTAALNGYLRAKLFAPIAVTGAALQALQA